MSKLQTDTREIPIGGGVAKECGGGLSEVFAGLPPQTGLKQEILYEQGRKWSL